MKLDRFFIITEISARLTPVCIYIRNQRMLLFKYSGRSEQSLLKTFRRIAELPLLNIYKSQAVISEGKIGMILVEYFFEKFDCPQRKVDTRLIIFCCELQNTESIV